MYKIMTAGPTQVRENVRMARSTKSTNPDLDLDFFEFYKNTCSLMENFFNCSGEGYILGGEGILGLEAACASMIEPKDRVLVIDNGVFGKGFADFVKIYGGEAVEFSAPYDRPVDIDELKEFLKKDSNFQCATIVHCDTPSGVLNNIKEICELLSEFNIISIVDSVAGMFGETIDFDEWKIDILCGGSQKVLSAPPGLTLVLMSEKAMAKIEKRETPIASFYANLAVFRSYYENKWFPYTMPISDIKGLRVALDNVIADKDIFTRHEKISEATRKAVLKAGLELYLKEGYSSTVTALKVPKGLTANDILETMTYKYNVMISGSLGVLAGQVIRIGHMGENSNIKDVAETMHALDNTFNDLGYNLDYSLEKAFMESIERL